jgi:hypothetical protein
MRSDEIAIETAKTSKVTAAVAVMSIVCKKKCKSQSANPRNEKPSRQKAESADILGENSCKPTEKPFSENEKRPVTKEISA